MPEYQWQPIEDIPGELYAFSDPDLRALEEEWQQARATTPQETLDKILTGVTREWAIETGKIEGLYTLSKGITKTLIQQGISAKLIPQDSTNIGPLLLTELLKDQQEVIEGLMDYVAQSKPLTLHYIRQMHQVFTRHQDTTEALTEDGIRVNIPLTKGDWKKWPNNPLQDDKTIHEYCSPEQVPNEMERLLALHQKHIAANVSPEVEAAFLHHRFTQIHPFQDGNGRIARALASLIFLQAGDFPFVVKDEERQGYIDALEDADQGDLTKLLTFMIDKEKDLIYRALSEAQSIDLDQQLNTIGEKAEEHYKILNEKKDIYSRANDMASGWVKVAEEVLGKVKVSLQDVETLTGTLSENFSYLHYDAIHQDVQPPAGKRMLQDGQCFTVVINSFGHIGEELRLFIYPIGSMEYPEQIMASLHYLFEEELVSFAYDVDQDSRIGNLRFREWFQENITQVINVWIEKWQS